MKIVSFSLLNYARIFTGMGLYELNIDFSKCRNIITLITGANGVGKSTLKNALTPFPDSSVDFLPNLEARKRMVLDDFGTIYELEFISPINSSMTRGTTKAFIKKNNIELNPTGNVGSYKDIIFSEFEMDSNYMALTNLSSTDKGMAEKRPAERKKFVAGMLNSLEVYNGINKEITKRVNIVKSYINNLDGKIKLIGDPKQLESRMANVNVSYKNAKLRRDQLMQEKAEAEGFIKSVDPDGRIQESYNEIKEKLTELNKNVENCEQEKASLLESLKVNNNIDEINDTIDKFTACIGAHINEIEKLEKEKIDKTAEREDDIKRREELRVELENLKNGYEINSINNALERVRKEMKSISDQFKGTQIPFEAISRDEFITIFQLMDRIRESIMSIYSNYSALHIATAVDMYYNKDNRINLNDLLKEQNKTEVELLSIESQIESTISRLEAFDNLEKPKECKVTNCPYILTNTTLANDLNKLYDNRKTLQEKVKQYSKDVYDAKIVLSLLDELKAIVDTIDNNILLLNKMPMAACFIDKEALMIGISNGSPFNEVVEILKYVDAVNDIETYKKDKEKLIQLEADYKIAQHTKATIESMEKEIETLSININSFKENISTIYNTIENLKSINIEIAEKVQRLKQIVSYEEVLDLAVITKNQYREKYEKIKSDIEKIKVYVDKINNINEQLLQLEAELPALEAERDQINFSLTSMNTYVSDLAMYQKKYNDLNILKKYSAPSTGIQTLYMDMYMLDTLTMANQLLSMLFGGEYQLLRYIINENEFRMPFMVNGMTIDDISSGSDSQKAMMGMIISLVLANQASHKYLIPRLDEIDAGLDNKNRFDFLPTIYNMIGFMGINQLIMISHNLIESDLSNVDIIKLKGYPDDSTDYSRANIIFDYDKL